MPWTNVQCQDPITISVSQLTKKCVKIVFTDDAAKFYQNGILIAIAEKWNRLYKLIQSR